MKMLCVGIGFLVIGVILFSLRCIIGINRRGPVADGSFARAQSAGYVGRGSCCSFLQSVLMTFCCSFYFFGLIFMGVGIFLIHGGNASKKHGESFYTEEL